MPVTATWGMPFHQPGQHLPPAQDGKPRARAAASSGLSSLTAVGVDHDVGVPQVFGPVAPVDAPPQPRQPPGDERPGPNPNR